MDEYFTNDHGNIEDFTQYLMFCAEHEAYYKNVKERGCMFKQNMGAAQLLYFMTCEDDEYISYKMEQLRSDPLFENNVRYFRTFVFVEDFTRISESSFDAFLASELDRNINARVLSEFIVYNFNTGVYHRIGGGRVQDRLLAKLLDASRSYAFMTPEERHLGVAEKSRKYSAAESKTVVYRHKGILDPALFLVIINIAVFVTDTIAEIKLGYRPLEYYGIQDNSLVLQGQWWRLITAMFLHDDLSHIAGNMLMLIYLSRVLMRYYSYAQYIAIYLISGAVGNIFTLILMNDGSLSLGASGAIMGLGGVLIYRIIFGNTSGSFRHMGSYLALAFMVIYNLAYGLFAENINNYAHFSGFIAGFAAAAVMSAIQKKNTARKTA